MREGGEGVLTSALPSSLPQPAAVSLQSGVLDELKRNMQEELLRKAAQKEALAAMDEEQQR